MNEQKYIALFEQVIGRKPSPVEFVKARATGFDPKQIRMIAGDRTSVIKETIPHFETPQNNLRTYRYNESLPVISPLRWRLTGLILGIITIFNFYLEYMKGDYFYLEYYGMYYMCILPLITLIICIVMLVSGERKVVANTFTLLFSTIMIVSIFSNIQLSRYFRLDHGYNLLNYWLIPIIWLIILISLFSLRRRKGFYDLNIFYAFVCLSIFLTNSRCVAMIYNSPMFYLIGKLIALVTGICALIQTPTQKQVIRYNRVGMAQPYGQDHSSFGIALLSFFIPVVGLVLWVVWKDQFPFKSRSALNGAITGIVVWTLIPIIFYLIIIGVGYSLYNSYRYY